MEDSQPSLSQQLRDLHVRNCTTTIPFDLIIDILSLLPAKSLLRFQSVSKLWFSTIRSKTFADSFLTRSKTRPRLLFTFCQQNSWKESIFSVPEHNINNYDDKTSSVMARYHMTISDPDYYYVICGSVNGFVVCLKCDATLINLGNTIPFSSMIAVHNPTTRQVVKLPDVTPKGRCIHARLGYDPVEDQYKVLCVMMFALGRQDIQQEHFVCTVSSSQKQEWRKIENPTGDSYQSDYVGIEQICIDGALYYGVDHRIVRFNVRSEKIEFIKIPKETYISTSSYHTLFNYCGKLGRLQQCFSSIRMMSFWVLEDAEKQEWSSMRTYDLPYHWEAILGFHEGRNHTGDVIVFYPWLKPYKPFYVCYYDFNKKSKRTVEIRGLESVDFTGI